MKIGLSEIIEGLAEKAKLDKEYAASFRDRIVKNERVLDEFVYFLKTGNFKGDYSVENITITDIVVYQIDHFKAAMDWDRPDMKYNSEKMILKAFETMMDIDEDRTLADKINDRLFSESGTDGTEMGTQRII